MQYEMQQFCQWKATNSQFGCWQHSDLELMVLNP